NQVLLRVDRRMCSPPSLLASCKTTLTSRTISRRLLLRLFRPRFRQPARSTRAILLGKWECRTHLQTGLLTEEEIQRLRSIPRHFLSAALPFPAIYQLLRSATSV